MAGKDEQVAHRVFEPFKRLGLYFRKSPDLSTYLGHKFEKAVDFLLSWPFQIEFKGTEKDGVLRDRLTEIQHELLSKWGGHVLLLMEDPEPRAPLPKGGDLYLVPYQAYKEFEEATSGQRKSIRRHKGFRAFGADEFLKPYQLEYHRGWVIPKDHPFWIDFRDWADRFNSVITSIEEWRDEGFGSTSNHRTADRVVERSCVA